MENFINICLYLIIYSFLGWVCESIYCSILDRKIVNRGFVNGPFCPIYGFGALIIIFLLKDFKHSVFLTFIFGLIFASILEYITSFLMEILFHSKWWDYSNYRFNIHGRVCLLNSTLFGLLSIFLQFDLHPKVQSFINIFSYNFKVYFLIIFSIYFTVDLLSTIYSVLKLNNRIKNLAFIKLSILEKYKELSDEYKELKVKHEFLKIKKGKLYSIHFLERRIINAFPNLKHKKYYEQINDLREHFKNKKDAV